MSRPDIYDARVEVQRVELYQADCPQCGWHTRQSDDKRWIEQLAMWHRKNCPNPKPARSGGLLQCGCWANLVPGSSVAPSPAKATPWQMGKCPNGHNEQVIVKCNVPDPSYFEEAV